MGAANTGSIPDFEDFGDPWASHRRHAPSPSCAIGFGHSPTGSGPCSTQEPMSGTSRPDWDSAGQTSS